LGVQASPGFESQPSRFFPAWLRDLPFAVGRDSSPLKAAQDRSLLARAGAQLTRMCVDRRSRENDDVNRNGTPENLRAAHAGNTNRLRQGVWSVDPDLQR